MDQLQNELDVSNGTGVPIQIVGINECSASCSAAMTSGRDLPLLQDVCPTPGVQSSWGATRGELYIVDGCSELVAVFDTASQDLRIPAYYGELKQALLAAAASWASGQ